MKRIIAIAAIALLSTGCMSSIGRFVTTISSGEPGTLQVERCELRVNLWTGGADVSNCDTSPVGVMSQTAVAVPVTTAPTTVVATH